MLAIENTVLLQAVKMLGSGILGIFVVMGLIALVVRLLTKR